MRVEVYGCRAGECKKLLLGVEDTADFKKRENKSSKERGKQ